MCAGVSSRRKRGVRFSMPPDKTVLVGVLKRRRDLKIFLDERWYRMPVRYAPKRPFGYLALYEPAFFGPEGKRILWYARVLGRGTFSRKTLLPAEADDPRADEAYVKISVAPPRLLSHPIRNAAPRRVCFGFTTIGKLLTAKNLLELFDIPPTEDVMRRALREAGIPAEVQKWVAVGKKGRKKRFRLDFAVRCEKGNIAIECDNRKAHKGKRQRERDRAKDAALREGGWEVLRFSEHDLMLALPECLARLQSVIGAKGGIGSTTFLHSQECRNVVAGERVK